MDVPIVKLLKLCVFSITILVYLIVTWSSAACSLDKNPSKKSGGGHWLRIARDIFLLKNDTQHLLLPLWQRRADLRLSELKVLLHMNSTNIKLDRGGSANQKLYGTWVVSKNNRSNFHCGGDLDSETVLFTFNVLLLNETGTFSSLE